MDDVDLSQFQFDYDMSWAALFLNADGTVYGRYGTRDAGPYRAEELISIDGLVRALDGALALHDEYPGNRDALAGKQGRPLPWRTPADVPVARRIGFGSCTHCHHVAEGLARVAVLRREPIVDALVWPYPTVDRLGFSFDVDHGIRVEAVTSESAAARAGLTAGDVVLSVDGQPIISHADVQWALHHVTADHVKIAVEREGSATPVELRLALAEGWRRGDASWRESRRTLRPGFSSTRLEAPRRRALDIPDGVMALEVGHVFGGGLRRGGVVRGDVLVSVADTADDWREGDLLLFLRSTYAVRDDVPIVVLREGERHSITIRLP